MAEPKEKRAMLDVAMLNRRMQDHDDEDDVYGKTDDDKIKLKAIRPLLDDWKAYRAWRNAPKHHDLMILTPAPLIADGLYRVSLDPAGNTTAALVHVKTEAAPGGVTEEQWLVFEADGQTPNFTFSEVNVDYTLAITTAISPPRLPSPGVTTFPTTPPPSLYWSPVSFGEAVQSTTFFNTALGQANLSGGPSFRYAFASSTTTELTTTAPGSIKEQLKSGKPRRWEEEMTSGGWREWVYGEHEGAATGTPEYTPVTIHMAWRGDLIGAPASAASSAFQSTVVTNANTWLSTVRTRLGISPTVSGKYAKADVRLYSATEFKKLSAKPTP